MPTDKVSAGFFSATTFISAVHNLAHLPEDTGSEVVFAGRSNAGKSSAINVITGKSGLARTSKSPGRTRQIMFFRIGEDCRLVDLPGYGFAKTSRDLQQHWGRSLPDYLRARESLRALVVVMDARHPLKPMDRQLLAWSGNLMVRRHILLTKEDKLSKSRSRATLGEVQEAVKADNVTVQLFSATRNTGVDEAREFLCHCLSG